LIFAERLLVMSSWAWRRFSVGHQVLRAKLARVADALFHWQRRSFKTCWAKWKLSVVPPLRVVHPLLVLGIFMLRRQGRPVSPLRNLPHDVVGLFCEIAAWLQRWMSTLDSCEVGAHDAIVLKPTHQRRLEAGQVRSAISVASFIHSSSSLQHHVLLIHSSSLLQDSLRLWFVEQIFGAWVQYTDECFTVLDSAVRHWAGRNWGRHFMHWRLYMSAVKYQTGRIELAENHYATANARLVLTKWRDYLVRLLAMRVRVWSLFPSLFRRLSPVRNVLSPFGLISDAL
jgi:hypothetical protein